MKKKPKFKAGQTVFYIGKGYPSLKGKRGTVSSAYPDCSYTVKFKAGYYPVMETDLSGGLVTATSWMQEKI